MAAIMLQSRSLLSQFSIGSSNICQPCNHSGRWRHCISRGPAIRRSGNAAWLDVMLIQFARPVQSPRPEAQLQSHTDSRTCFNTKRDTQQNGSEGAVWYLETRKVLPDFLHHSRVLLGLLRTVGISSRISLFTLCAISIAASRNPAMTCSASSDMCQRRLEISLQLRQRLCGCGACLHEPTSGKMEGTRAMPDRANRPPLRASDWLT